MALQPAFLPGTSIFTRGALLLMLANSLFDLWNKDFVQGSSAAKGAAQSGDGALLVAAASSSFRYFVLNTGS